MKNSPENIYVLSDLHGNYIDFLRMLEFIKFSESDVLYILGDIFNKYGSGLRIYEYIKDRKNIILIKGNHEFYVEKALRHKILFCFYPKKLKFLRNELKNKDREYKKELYLYLKNLILYKKIDNYILIHDNLYIPKKFKNLNIDEILKKQNDINCFIFSNEEMHTHLKEIIIKGHIPVQNFILNKESNDYSDSYNKIKIFIKENYIFIDGDCGNKEVFGHLLCLEIKKSKEYLI